ncbi:MAG: fibronectin-binding autotransporter adhesin [Actinomycetota bacterium]|nr:fibronectin-binding autotransporter adhesin [Actinomycetota bacterium]
MFTVRAYNSAGRAASTPSASVSSTSYAAPQVPPLPTVVAGSGQITLSWTAIGSGTVASPVTAVRAVWCTNPEMSAGCGTSADLPPSSTSTTAAPLVDGTPYYLRLVTVNSSATTNGAVTSPTTPRGVPAAPTSLAVAPTAASSTRLDVSWAPVSSTPAAPVTGYRLFRWNPTGGVYVQVAQQAGVTFSNTGLTAGTSYGYAVAAYGPAGQGPLSGQVSGVPIGAPATPPTPTRVAGNAQVSLSWAAVGPGTAAAPITSIAVQYCTNVTMTIGCVTGASLPTSSTGAVVTGLANGTTYYFRLVSGNAVLSRAGGVGSSIPIGPPAVPGVVGGVAGSGQVVLSFPAVGTGTAANPITGVRVQSCTDAGMTTGCSVTGNLATTATTTTKTGLVNGTAYYFRLVSFNTAATTTSGPTAGPFTPLAAPAVLAAPVGVAGDSQVTLTWAAPGAGTVAAPIASVAVQYCTNTGMTIGCVTGASLPTSSTGAVVTGLANGTTYYFRLRATNAVTTTSGSRNAGTRPIGPPAASAAPVGVPGPSRVVLSWPAPGTGTAANPITGVRVQYCTNPGMTTGCVVGATLPTSSTGSTVLSLTTGVTYYFRLVTVNALTTTDGLVSAGYAAL